MMIFFVNNVISQTKTIENYPPVWNVDRIQNSMSFLFPFKESNTFIEVAIFFEKIEKNNSVILRYRVFSHYSMDKLYMKDIPEMLIKIGDGTILKGKKERVVDGVVDFGNVIEVYYVLDYNLQQKILKSGIEKARIAYVYNFGGLNENQIFDAYTKDSEISSYSIKDLLNQILTADISKVKKESLEKSLEYGF